MPKKKRRKTRKWRGASYHQSLAKANAQMKRIREDGYEARRRMVVFTLPNGLKQYYLLVEWRPKPKRSRKK